MDRKKKRSEHIPDRTDQLRDPARGLRIADYDSNEERSRRSGQPQEGGAQGQQKAETQAGQ